MSNIIHSLKDKLVHHKETEPNTHSHSQTAPSTGVASESAALSASGPSHAVEHDLHQAGPQEISAEHRGPNSSHNLSSTGSRPTRLTNNPADAMNNSGIQPFIADDPYYTPDKHHKQVSKAVPEPSPMTINDNTLARQSEMTFRK